MSSILYYSNFCEHSKKLLQILGKTQVSKDIHFICIDKRVKGEDNKLYIVFENGKRIIMPENVTKVPALLLLNDNFKVLYGESIQQHLKPVQEVATFAATQNNMEPSAFSLGGGGVGGGGGYSAFGGVVSDNFSFLDMDSESLTAKGDGGIRQMHQYVGIFDGTGYNSSIQTPADDHSYKQSKLPEGLTVEQLQKSRETEFANLSQTRR